MRELTRPPECVSNLVLDEWLAGALDAGSRAGVDAHLATCARCSAQLDARRREHAAFLVDAPSFDALTRRVAPRAQPQAPPIKLPVSTRRLRMAKVLASCAAAAAAAAALLLAYMRPGFEPPAVSTRAKGAPHLGFFVSRDGKVARGAAGDTVYEGDGLRFTYSADRALYLAVLDRDAAGASVFFPSATRARRVPAGNDAALDFSVTLDARLGTERIYGVFCPDPFDVEPVRVALARDAAPPLAGACTLDVLALHKATRP